MARITRLLPLLCLLAFAPSPAAATDDGTWTLHVPNSLPPHAELQGGVLDPVRSRMITFGGFDGREAVRTTRALSLASPQRWSVLSSEGPSARYEHTLVYDSARDRVLLFGGRDVAGSRFAEVWALSLSGTPAWTLVTTAGVPPSARSGHEAIYDPVRDRMLVIAGYDGQYENDVWELSLSGTPTWTLLAPSGTPPRARRYTAAVYDPAGDRVLVIGGEESDNVLPPAEGNDVWELSLGASPAWTELAPLGTPLPARLLHEAVYDNLAQRVLVYGGCRYGRLWKDDMWALNLTSPPAWTSLTTTTPRPRKRSGHSMVFLPVTNSVFIYGGRDSAAVQSDQHMLELAYFPARWSELPRLGAPIPGGRISHEGAYDPARRRFIVFGGYNFSSHRNDLWAYDLDGPPNWTRLDTSTPRPDIRANYAFVAQPSADRLVLFGGQNFSTYFGDLWSFNLGTATWATLAASGTPPSARVGPVAVYDAARDRMLLVGGLSNAGVALNDVWSLTLGASPAWTPINPSGASPAGRFGHAIVHDVARDRLVVFGGQAKDGTMYGDLWTLNLTGPPHWTPLATAGAGPGPCFAPEMIHDPVGDRMIVCAGYSPSNATRLVYALDFAVSPPAWSLLSPAGENLPQPRDLFASMYDPVLDRLVIMGGNGDDGSDAYDDVWSLDWSRTPTPALLSLAEEAIESGAVTLTWFTPDGPGQPATAFRRTEDSDWQEIGALVSDASGRFVLEDRVPAGGRFAYRLEAGGAFTEAHWVTIPGALAFALEGAWPNPSKGALTVGFRLPDARPASLELVDVRGRVMIRRDVLGAGPHVVELGKETRLASGVYVVRLVQGDRTERRKIAVVR